MYCLMEYSTRDDGGNERRDFGDNEEQLHTTSGVGTITPAMTARARKRDGVKKKRGPVDIST